MGLIFSGVFGLLRRVPLWVWVVVVALAWGGWQRHLAQRSAAQVLALQEEIAAATQRALTAALAETARRVTKQQEELNHATTQLAAAQQSAQRSSAAALSLRSALASYARAGAVHPSAPGDGKTDLLADLLGLCGERYTEVAAAADRAVIAGSLCERTYDTLTVKEATP